MADILSKGSLFPEELIPDFIKKTTGASALAKLCSATPIPFNGVKEFTFSLDKEVDIVAENGAKTKGGLTVESTNSHENDFTNDKITFRVKERLALQVKYPKAFVKVALGKASK